MRFFLFLLLLPIISHAQLDSVIVGSAGGFSGKVTSFKIMRRCVAKGDGFTHVRYKETARLKRKNRKLLFKEAQQLWEQQPGFEHPYNIYKFIVLYSKGKSMRLTWGDPAYPVPGDIRKCYDDIFTILGSLKFNSK